MNRREGIHHQYETWPYPHYPLFASVRRLDTWQLNADYLFDRCGTGPAPARPRIWIAGCGTFQPYTTSLANPRARILATDISRHSLRLARRRCLWQGMTGHEFAAVDLEDEKTWPDGPFDYIECYGVLMNLADPSATLRAMAARLTDRGVLRVMVYPHYSRRRIFQVQRVAKLLGLDFRERHHPVLLREVMTALPADHPLRYAFVNYPDSRNEPGIVDGFLHAGDRGFTGLQLARLIGDAGLEPGFWFHRPWGQPDRMRAELSLDVKTEGEVLDYLDVWQELRTNLIVCLRKKGVAKPRSGNGELRMHPMLNSTTAKIPLPGKLRMWWQSMTGVRLRSRTEAEPLVWSRSGLALARRVARGGAAGCLPAEQAIVERASREGILLGGASKALPWQLSELAATADEARPGLQTGRLAANPFYSHLFEAWYRTNGDPRREIDRWEPHADPLETDGQFGLTPFATYRRFASEIDVHLRREAGPAVDTFGDVQYVEERDGMAWLRRFLAGFPRLPQRDRTAAQWRELWVLLGSHRHLFLDAEAT